MAIEITSTVVRVEGMMTAPVDQDIVILNMLKNNYVSLDQIGRRIWELIEAPVTVSELCLKLGDEFEGGNEQIVADVLSFLNELLKEGLMRVAL
jgi:hypothetical protein